MSHSTYLASGLFLSTVIYWLLSPSRAKLRLPPGPRKLPIIKNLLDFPLGEQWVTFAKWSEQYKSDILHVEAAGHSMVILNSYEAMTDLLDKRSSIYSSRPHSKVICDMIGWDWLLVIMPYNNAWKEKRRLLVKQINPSNTSDRRRHEKQQLHVFLNHLLREPEGFLTHARHLAGAVTISMAYGIKVEEKNDPNIRLAESTMARLSEAFLPGQFLADTFDWLRHIPEGFPGTAWKGRIRQLNHEMIEFRDRPYQLAVEEIANGTATDSLVSRCLQEGNLTREQESFVKEAAGMLFAGGADTTVSVLSTFFLAMICFPQAYTKAQAEVDQILNGRLSEDCDEDSLPYLNALVKELMRWQPAFPMGVFHSVICDDEYRGYHIPANSLVVPNVWAIFRNPEMFPDPEVFRPERFLKDGKLHVPGLDPSDIIFGFGRRVCPGRHIAESIIFHFIASVLSLFDISKALDTHGNPIEPPCVYNTAVTRHPLPFKCSIEPRSIVAEQLIRSLPV